MEPKMERKFSSEIKSINQDGTISVYVSPRTIDREHELIIPEAWQLDNFKMNPVLVSQHAWYGSLQNVIGKVIDIGTDEKGLWVTLEYYSGNGNDEADWAHFLAQQKLAAYSVGFITKERISGDNYMVNGVKPESVISKAELLELSQVIVPANQDANVNQNFVKTFKAFLNTKTEEPAKKTDNPEEKKPEEGNKGATEPEGSEPEVKSLDELLEDYIKTKGEK